jgi:hypothetical protein
MPLGSFANRHERPATPATFRLERTLLSDALGAMQTCEVAL